MSGTGKIGRNDPCPCGSGRKYKHCCGSPTAGPASGGGKIFDASEAFAARRAISELADGFDAYRNDPRAGTMTFQEMRGRPNEATAVLQGLQDYLSKLDLKSESDLRGAVDAFVRGQGEAGIEDFLGLSPRQMHAILHGDAEDFAPWLDVGLGVKSSDEATCPILRQALFYLRRLASAGPMKLTSAGYLPPAFVQEWFSETFLNEDPELKALMKVRREVDYPHLGLIEIACSDAGLVGETESGSPCITEEGAGLLDSGNMAELYRKLFFAFLDAYADPYSPGADRRGAFAAKLPLFFFHILRVKGGRPLGRGELKDILARAFPQAREDGFGLGYLLSAGGIQPAEILGLIEWQEIGSLMPEKEKPVRRTEFYDRALRWK